VSDAEDHPPPVVNHVGLCVRDLERSRRFYQEVLGFEPDREMTLPDEATADFLAVARPVNLTAVYLTRGPVVLELLHFDRPDNPDPAGRVFNEPGLTHLSFSVDDLAASVAAVRAAGGDVVTDLAGMAAIVRDPDGQLLELLPMAYARRLGRA
jgi:catechol 2,3-dioxygenase-like lactoylglutathione lyase family enzyme